MHGLRGVWLLLLLGTLSRAWAEPAASFWAGTAVLEPSLAARTALPEGWRIEGGDWSIADGRLVGRATEYLSRLVLPTEPLGDVALEADVAFLAAADPGRWLALMVHRRPGQPGPFVLFTHRFDRSRASGVELSCGDFKGKGVVWNVFRRGSAPLPGATNETHRARVEVRGTQMRGFIDGQLTLTAPVPAAGREPGEVGFVVSSCTAVFGNVKVEKLPPMTDAERQQAAQATAVAERALPLVVAHRGNSRFAPENTLVAFREAFGAGADMVEADLRLSRDGVVVICHDGHVKRTTNGPATAVSALTLAELKQLDAGSWKDAKYAGERIPTFDEVLDLAKGRGSVLLDLKVTGLGPQIAEVVKRHGMENDVIAAPWNLAEAAVIHHLLPATPIMVIGSAPAAVDEGWFAPLLTAGVRGFNFAAGSLTPTFVRAASRRALAVFGWTVDEPAEMLRLARLGVTGILTDDPALLRQTLTDLRLREHLANDR